METTVGIDFIQYSIQVYGGMFTSCQTWGEHIDLLKHVIINTLGDFAPILLEGTWREGDNKIAPYSHSVAIFTVQNIRIANLYWSDKSLDTVLVQHTGQGCQIIPNILAYVDYVQPRLNRIDLALDAHTDERPEAFYKAYKGRLSTAYENSRTGETFYIGSRKSDKLCRIYRYNQPHERAHLLRFEIQYRGEYARAIVWHISQNDLQSVIYGAIEAYKLPTEKYLGQAATGLHLGKKKHGDTIAWLNRAVKPTIERLILSGEFDAYQWMQEIYDGLAAF